MCHGMSAREQWAYMEHPNFSRAQDAFLRVCRIGWNISRAALLARQPSPDAIPIDRWLYDEALVFCVFTFGNNPPMRFSGIEVRPWDGLAFD